MMGLILDASNMAGSKGLGFFQAIMAVGFSEYRFQKSSDTIWTILNYNCLH